jgi:hypothetical protein
MNPYDELEGADEPPAPPRKEISAADRELLELAAHTLGAARFEDVDGEEWVNLHFDEGPAIYGWNPLLHSDDALMLAVKLELDVNHRVVGGRRVEVIPAGFSPVAEPYMGDALMATRRAIVRAAADVGEVLMRKPRPNR